MGVAHQRKDSQQPSACWSPHITDKESEAHQDQAAFPRSPTKGTTKPEVEPKQSVNQILSRPARHGFKLKCSHLIICPVLDPS